MGEQRTVQTGAHGEIDDLVLKMAEVFGDIETLAFGCSVTDKSVRARLRRISADQAQALRGLDQLNEDLHKRKR